MLGKWAVYMAAPSLLGTFYAIYYATVGMFEFGVSMFWEKMWNSIFKCGETCGTTQTYYDATIFSAIALATLMQIIFTVFLFFWNVPKVPPEPKDPTYTQLHKLVN